ncbi:hypothetical protein FI667_g11696, partial [Globisporangium splendens]
MSFLELLDDQQSTLEVALAFIDECDVGDHSDASTTSSSSTAGSPLADTSSHGGSPASDEQQQVLFDVFVNDIGQTPELSFDALAKANDTANQTKGEAKSKASGDKSSGAKPTRPPRKSGSSKARSNAEAVSRLRARKKAEAVYLRDQVVQLEAKLKQLQLARLSNNPLHALLQFGGDESKMSAEEKERYLTIKPKTVSVWLEIAAIQAKERYKSEALNMKLKDAIEKQVRTNKMLEGILGKKVNMQGIELLLDDQQQHLYNDSLLTKEKILLEELRESIGTMYQMVTTIFEHTWDIGLDSVSCSTQVKEDPMSGPYVELRTNTPLKGGHQEAGQFIWNHSVKASLVMHSDKFYMKKRNVTANTYEKSYTIFVDGLRGPVELHGISFVQKIDEPHRFIYMWSSRIFLSRGEMAFIESGWMVAARLHGNAKYPAVFQTCYRVWSDPHRGESQSMYDPNVEVIKEKVLQALTSRTREYHQSIQNMLMDEFAGFRIQQRLTMATI